MIILVNVLSVMLTSAFDSQARALRQVPGDSPWRLSAVVWRSPGEPYPQHGDDVQAVLRTDH